MFLYVLHLLAIKFQRKLMDQLWENGKKTSFGTNFGPVGPVWAINFFFKNLASSVTRYYGHMSSWGSDFSPSGGHISHLIPFPSQALTNFPHLPHNQKKKILSQNKSKNNASSIKSWRITAVTCLDNFSSTCLTAFEELEQSCKIFVQPWLTGKMRQKTTCDTIVPNSLSQISNIIYSRHRIKHWGGYKQCIKTILLPAIATSKIFLTTIILKIIKPNINIIKGVSPTWAKTNGW